MMEEKTHQAFIVGIDQRAFLIEKKNGGTWAYLIKHAPERIRLNEGLLQLLADRQEAGWPELALATFDRQEKGLELKEIGV